MDCATEIDQGFANKLHHHHQIVAAPLKVQCLLTVASLVHVSAERTMMVLSVRDARWVTTIIPGV